MATRAWRDDPANQHQEPVSYVSSAPALSEDPAPAPHAAPAPEPVCRGKDWGGQGKVKGRWYSLREEWAATSIFWGVQPQIVYHSELRTKPK